jgi:hypothetical protein
MNKMIVATNNKALGREAKRVRWLSGARREIVGLGYSEGPRVSISTTQVGCRAEPRGEMILGGGRLASQGCEEE